MSWWWDSRGWTGGNIVVFVYDDWVAQFPEMAFVPNAVAQSWFDTAGDFYLRNDGTAPIRKATTQLRLLYFLTAHLVALFAAQPKSGLPVGATPANPTGGIIGRISNASEGSVSVTAEYAAVTRTSEAFFAQTRYGVAYWEASKVYRLFRYVPGPRRFFG